MKFETLYVLIVVNKRYRGNPHEVLKLAVVIRC